MEILTNEEDFFRRKNEDNILLDEITMTYVQDPDCTEDRDGDWQRLTISTRDNGVAKFLNIKTENWSIDDSDSLIKVIEDFKQRIGYEHTGNT